MNRPRARPILLSLFLLLSGAPAGGTDLRGLDPEIHALGLRAAERVLDLGEASKRVLTVIDYRLPSTEPRLWVIDLDRGAVLHHELVAHGRGSGDNHARAFSNRPGSKQSSIGVFVTEGTYEGQHGYTLRLRGLEPGINDRARARKIVIHGAWYVSDEHVRTHGRLGRSWGCPALDRAVARTVIDAIRGGSVILAYGPGWSDASAVLASTGPGDASDQRR